MRGKSAFALFAISLRVARGLTQEELAGEHLSVLKNIERGHGVSVDSLARLYRDNPRLREKHRVTDQEWLQLVMHWVTERAGDGGRGIISLDAAAQAHQAVRSEIKGQLAKLAEGAERLGADEAALIMRLMDALMRDRKSERLFQTLTAIVDLAENGLEGASDHSPRRRR